jgi:RNA polymerase sigma-70 factor (ECF subfamily)
MAADAEDFVQESLIRLMQRNERSHGTLTVSAGYLRKVAYCTVVDELRRRQRTLDQLPTNAAANADEIADESQADDAFIGSAIAQCLAHQSPDRQRALTLHLLGHSVPEAARILGCRTKRAENLVYRGLVQLRECLTRRGLRP